MSELSIKHLNGVLAIFSLVPPSVLTLNTPASLRDLLANTLKTLSSNFYPHDNHTNI